MIKVIVIDRNAAIAGCFYVGIFSVQRQIIRPGADIICAMIVDVYITATSAILKIVFWHGSLIFDLIEKIEEIIHYPVANTSISYR